MSSYLLDKELLSALNSARVTTTTSTSQSNWIDVNSNAALLGTNVYQRTCETDMRKTMADVSFFLLVSTPSCLGRLIDRVFGWSFSFRTRSRCCEPMWKRRTSSSRTCQASGRIRDHFALFIFILSNYSSACCCWSLFRSCLVR